MPVATLYSLGLLHLRVTHAGADTVVDTRRVSYDKRRTVVSLSLTDSLEGLRIVGTHCDLSHINIAIGRSDKAEILLADALARCSELGDSAERSSLRCLTAGIGVNLGVDNKHIHILARCEHVIEATETYVVSGTITGNDPLGTLGDVLLHCHDTLADVAAASLAERNNLLCHTACLGSIILVVKPSLCKSLDLVRALVALGRTLHQSLDTSLHFLIGNTHAKTKLSEVLKERVTPCRTVTLRVDSIGSRGNRT